MHKKTTRQNRKKIYVSFMIAFAFAFACMARPTFAADIVVDSLLDDVDNDAECTLREAIMNANTNAATTDCVAGDSGALDTIRFTVQGTIAVLSELPIITDGSLIIDGTDAAGSPSCGPTRTLTLSVDGTNAGVTSGINTNGVSDVTIRGLNIHSFSENGIQVSDSSNVLIQCNHIGTDIAGSASDANGKNGILINDGSVGTIVGTDSNGVNDATEYNVISGNNATTGASGIIITEASQNSIIVGNRIGTDVTGLLALGNGGIGIQIQQASTGNRIGTNGDGNSDAEERNIVSGNGNHGISIFDLGTNNNIVAGNYIGLAVDGVTNVANDKSGVNITEGADGNLIGGTGAAAPNYISGNGNSGVWVQTSYADFISGTRTSNNTVQGNIIGLDINGDPQGNGNQGMLIDLTVNTVVNNNTISENNLRGIYVRGAETTISDNQIINNNRSGIEVTFDEGADVFNPESEAGTADDIVSSVNISDNVIEGNCINSNPCAGIYGNDDSVDPDNQDKGVTVAAANDIRTNNGDPDVIQYWYGGVEISDKGVLQSGTASVTSNNGGTVYALTEAVTAGAGLDSTILHGPADPVNSAGAFASTDVRTWAFIQEFEVDEGGVSTDFAPHVANNIPFSFDADAGTEPSDSGAGFVGEGIASPVHAAYTTANSSFTLTRYQIMEIATPYVTLAATPSVVEGNSAAVTVTVNTIQTVDVTVVVAYSDGTATNGTDYTPSTTTIVIPAGSMTASIPVNTGNDTTDEPDETYDVSISSVVNATDDSTAQTTTILDNDVAPAPGAPPEVTLDATQSITEGTSAAITINLNAPGTEDVTVVLSLSDGTANSGSDYTPPASLTVVIPAGDTSATISAPTTFDTSDELDETFIVDIDSVTNATDVSTPQTVTILDDDTPAPSLPTATITSTTPVLNEGETAYMTVTIDTVISEMVTFTVSYEDGTAIQFADYEPNLVTVNIPAGDLSANTSVHIVDDDIDEEDESFQVRIDSDVEMNYVNSPFIITIVDNDEAPAPPAADLPSVTLAATPVVLEGNAVAITATLSAVSTEDVLVTVRYLNETATGDDITPTTATIVIPAGSLSASILLDTVADDIAEGFEDFRVAIDSATNATDSSTPQVILINDPAPVDDDTRSPTSLDEIDEPGANEEISADTNLLEPAVYMPIY